MSESFKKNSFYKLNNHDKMNANSIIQPKPSKSLIVCQRNPIILSPTSKFSNPEIVRPNFSNQTSNNPNQNEENSPASVKVCSSHPDINYFRRSFQCSSKKPLEPLSPIMQKKNHSKKIRASCSVDTSWSPNLPHNNNNNEIRKSRFSYHSDDNDCIDNNILFEPRYAAASDDQASPLCKCDENI